MSARRRGVIFVSLSIWPAFFQKAKEKKKRESEGAMTYFRALKFPLLVRSRELFELNYRQEERGQRRCRKDVLKH